jgi:hypothetical protein
MTNPMPLVAVATVYYVNYINLYIYIYIYMYKVTIEKSRKESIAFCPFIGRVC